jgi:hypothetical protein
MVSAPKLWRVEPGPNTMPNRLLRLGKLVAED